MKHHLFFFRLLTIALCLFISLPGQSADRGYLALVGSNQLDPMPDSWSDGLVTWFLQQANHGNILILTCSDQTPELSDLLIQRSAQSARYLTLPHRFIADNVNTYKSIEDADGLIIVGNQMWDQYNLWRGTRTESAIRDFYASGKPIIGLGSSIRFLGGILVDQQTDLITPDLAIRTPFPANTRFFSDFCAFQEGVFIEHAFTRRGALPLLLGKMARYLQTFPASLTFGVGIDEQTVLLLDPDLTGTVLGAGAVYLIAPTASSTILLDPRLPPVFTNLNANIMTEGFVFDFQNHELLAAPPSANSDVDPPGPGPYTPIDFNGSATSSRALGEVEIQNLDHDSCALQLGLFTERNGLNSASHLVVTTHGFAQTEYYENRFGGLLWGLANHPGFTGLLLEQGGCAEMLASGVIAPQPMTNQPSLLVFDTREVQWHDFSHRRVFPDSKGPRQSVALIGLRIHQLATRCQYHLPSGNILVQP